MSIGSLICRTKPYLVFGLLASLMPLPLVLAVCLGELVCLTTSDSGKQLLGESVVDNFA